MSKENILATKISLKALITSLVTLWDEGFDAVDMEFIKPEEGVEPHIRIIVKEEYLHIKGEDEDDDEEEESPLDDEGLSDLI